MTIFVRTTTVFFIHKADTYAENGNYRGIEMMHYTAMALQALRVMVPTLIICLINAQAVQNFLNQIPTVITGGLQIVGGIIVVVGYAMVINMMDVPHLKPFFYIGFLFAAFTEFNLVGFGGLGLCLAILFLQLKYRNEGAVVQTVAASSVGQIDDDLDDDLDI